jgi:hypothetical protein
VTGRRPIRRRRRCGGGYGGVAGCTRDSGTHRPGWGLSSEPAPSTTFVFVDEHERGE